MTTQLWQHNNGAEYIVRLNDSGDIEAAYGPLHLYHFDGSPEFEGQDEAMKDIVSERDQFAIISLQGEEILDEDKEWDETWMSDDVPSCPINDSGGFCADYLFLGRCTCAHDMVTIQP